MLFTVLTALALSVGTLVETLPMFFNKTNVKEIASVKPYTPLELVGRDVYISEGCYNCHSQMIRPIMAETKRFGEYSKPGEFVYDHPFQWGSRRIGPDLAREGGKQSNLWHFLHMVDPAQVTPGTVMPTYKFLAETKTDFGSIRPRLRAMRALGVPYSNDEMANGVDLAKAQAADVAGKIVAQGGPKGLDDKEVVALIAYLQRLGTDLFAKPAEAAPAKAVEKPVAATPLSQLNAGGNQ